MNGLKKRRDDVVIALFENIEKVQIHNLIDEIGLGKKLKSLEEENVKLKEKNATLQKLNDKLAKDNETLRKYFPDTYKNKGEVGELSF